ncbi:histidine phosphatase family protein [Cytobacillus oceanisediminis]|uniref:histidine phosphatase family protein n=1 Tax=Cytobacillus oceanisediminis TaxID=665099 RepID=UPI0023DA89B5|nr:histidine phosphatase family protein [Cytobacillus oceanisediminis]MDF2036079.1 histidine phosphatase family protein [Cytobacillus oceanisediminis]
MEITLIRHGRSSLMEDHRMNSREFKKWIETYKHLGILEGETCSSDAIEKGISASFLLTSDLKRSIESARSINPSAKIQADPLFRETELPIPAGNLPGMRLRPNTWAVLLRLLWLCGYSQGCESYRDAKLRAKQASLTLTSIAKEHHIAVLVGHGFFNLLIARELQKAGWKGKRKTGSKHWNADTYIS